MSIPKYASRTQVLLQFLFMLNVMDERTYLLADITYLTSQIGMKNSKV